MNPSVLQSPFAPGSNTLAALTTANQGAAQTQATPTAPKKQPSWWERLLPTAGGIAGSIIGGLVPIPGLDIAASGALGALGGALGKEGENALTGQSGGVGTSAIENAIGGGLGTGVGDVIGGLSGLASNAAGGLTGRAGNFLGNLSDRLVAGQAAKGEVGSDLASFLRVNNGITSLPQAGQFADILTGGAEASEGNALINNAVEDLVKNYGPQTVNINDLAIPKLGTGLSRDVGPEALRGVGNPMQQILDNNGLDDTLANQVRSNVSGLVNKYPAAGGDISGEVEPLDALNFQRDLQGQANEHWSDYKTSKFTDSSDKRLAKTYTDLANEVGNRLGLDNISVPPEVQKALASDILEYGNSISPEAAQAVAQSVQAGDMSVADLRNLESNWVAVKKALQNTALKESKNFGTSTADLTKSTLPTVGSLIGLGGGRSAAGAGLGLLAGHPGADALGAGMLDRLSSALGNKGVQQVMRLLPQVGAVGAANLPNMASSPMASTNPLSSSNMQTGTNTMDQTSPLSSAFQLGIIDPVQYGGLAQSLAPTMQKYQMAQNALTNLGQAFGNAGGAQGGLTGLMTQLSSMLPMTAAHAYNQQLQATMAMLGSLMGTQPSALAGMAPNFMQAPGVAQQRLAGLAGLLQ